MTDTPRRGRRRLLLATGAVLGLGAAAMILEPWRLGIPDPADPGTTLAAVEGAIARLLPVPEATPAEVAALLGAGGPVVLLDVREPEEYAQSRIPGSLRVDPGASAAAVLAEHGARMAGATVVLYCAVGWRSGVVLDRLVRAGAEAGAATMLNMRGGIFRWHAEGRPLETAAGAAGVHHYDAEWGRLLERTLAAGG